MIRFACPGCASVYDVDDAKGGKTGMCPKCRSKFLIPMPKPAEPVQIPIPPPEPPQPEPLVAAVPPPPPPVVVEAPQPTPPPVVVEAPPPPVPVPAPPPVPDSPFDFGSVPEPPPPVPPPTILDAVVVQVPPPPIQQQLMLAAPPSTPSPNDPVEINPCPYCNSRASVYLQDLGTEIECPSCRRLFPAMRLGSAVPAVPPPPSRRSRYDDDDRDDRDDRRSRRSRRRDDDDDDDDDDRGSRRRSRSRGRSRDDGQGTVRTMRIISGCLCLAIGIMEILTALGLVCCAIFFTSVFAGMAGGMADSNPNPQARESAQMLGGIGTAIGVGIVVCGILFILKGFIYVMAGIGGLMKRGYGRTLMLFCAVMSVLSVLGYLGWGGTSTGTANVIGMAQALLGLLLHLGQAICGFMSTIGEKALLEYD